MAMKFAIKLLLATIFFAIIIYVFFCCERLVYYIILSQCNWPDLDPKNEDPTIEKTNENPLRFMVITDPHLLGSNEGYWLDAVRTDWEMKTAFQIAMNLHQPEVVFVLGDLTVEGEYCSDAEFNTYIKRFYELFAISKSTKMYIVAGNHDIGFHNYTNTSLNDRFEKGFNSPAVQLLTIRGNHFVLVNSITLEGDGCSLTLEGDGCSLCTATELQLAKIENTLKCTKGELTCDSTTKLKSYSRPILLQHFPLYRESDESCSEPDEAPYLEKIEKFKEAWDCLSKNATEKLLHQVDPRLVMDGHTHHGCTQSLPDGRGVEITVPSFNWRNKDNPSYELVVSTPNNYALKKCLMPTQTSAVIRYALGLNCLITFGMMYWYYKTRHRRKRCFIIA